MRSIDSSAKTMEEAVTQGLEKLGVSLGDVSIDIIDEGSKGLFGLIGGKPARVRLTVKDSSDDSDILSSLSLDNDNSKQTGKEKQLNREKTEAPKAGKAAKPEKGTQPEKNSKQPVAAKKNEKVMPTEVQATSSTQPIGNVTLLDPETAPGKAQRFLIEVTRMMGVDVSVAASVDSEGNVRVDMHGDTLGILIGRRGETLDALQYLTSLNVNRGQEEYTRVTIDTENYRAKREEALTRLANSALQLNEAVTTHSEGDEPNRHVVITLK